MVVGEGIEHGQNVKEAMLRSNAMRKQFLDGLASNSIEFTAIVQLSKNHEYKPLASLRLIQCLVNRPGWSEATARQAFDDQGFDVKDTVKNIRANSGKVERFAKMMSVPPDRWKARPSMPEGWPWFGKLSSLVSDSNNITPPNELSILMEGLDDEGVLSGEERHDHLSEDLASLMGDDLDG